VAIVGRGRVGRGLAAALAEAGAPVTLLPGRRGLAGARARAALAHAGATLLAVPDGAIEEVAGKVGPAIAEHGALFHLAGALGPEIIVPSGLPERRCGALHPLVSFARGTRPPELAGTTFALAGGIDARRVGRRLAAVLGAHTVTGRLQGAAYHGAAALAANGAAALATAAVGVLRELGLGDRVARRAVAGLLRSVADNVDRVGVPEALTGPVRRGDAATIARHREALRADHPAALRAYDATVPLLLETARAAGLSPAAARRVARVLRRGR
jgi:predicted short-subunit dehydrogenase-like oxidoreductase (DUF2520 family)